MTVDGVAIAPVEERLAEAQAAHPPCFGSREELLADLAEAMRPGAQPRRLAIFALEGFGEFTDRLGRVEGETLLAGLAKRFELAVGDAGSCYRPRTDEFALLCEAGGPSIELLLERAATALSEPRRPVPVTAAYGSIVVPSEASEVGEALRLADERLEAAQPGRPARERRRQVRPGSERQSATAALESTAVAATAPSEPLLAIHGELVEASANALRIRRVDQLLDIAATLTMLADAVRIDDREGGTLQGRPRDAARVPLLLKELGLKLAALVALDGPELVEATRLVREPTLAASMSAKVLTALDEIGAALTAA